MLCPLSHLTFSQIMKSQSESNPFHGAKTLLGIPPFHLILQLLPIFNLAIFILVLSVQNVKVDVSVYQKPAVSMEMI